MPPAAVFSGDGCCIDPRAISCTQYHTAVIILFSCVVLGCDDLDYAIVRTGLQVLANVSLGGERHQHAVWRQFFPEGFVEIARVRRKETSDPLCMIVYVCCDGSHEPFAEFCKEPGLTIMAEIVHTASTAGFGEDWMKLLLSRICLEETYFSPLFTMLSSLSPLSVGDIERRTANFASEQAYLLGIMSEILNERIREIHVCNDFVLHVLAIFRRAAGSVNFTSRGHSSLPTGCNSIDVLGYSLTILRDICARDSSMGADGNHSSGDVINAILSGGLLDLLLHLLGELELPLTIRKSMKQDENHSYTPPKVCPYKGFRRDIVSVIGNCAYRRKLVQDEIRQKSGILLLLQHCVSDEDDPFLREWSIWSVRNLLEGNAENQKVVADLELQGSVNVTEITGLGLRVEVDPNTGRVKLVNIS
ncbi:hypothetical protein Nepgr_002399 [Nepenthes gracilis]|uniref:Ataxin-10 domain-containing protein n=1 Tax=Nepenthes gracilis TaxID=150966 RepID=A0AAD3RYE9_NEPGR|nr:hypothetical protein Nepgr_002399 [Nepenthes gracilis]